MTTIQLQISDDLIRAYGLEALQQRLAKFLEWERFYLSAKSVEEAVKDAGEDNDQLWAEARKAAWSKFKEQQLKNVLP
ncbi:MAG: hypothetical protein K9J37_19845 [Saprospiraceae bacterium]|nr:hypothetical protein [Saprospiraceae bacterium]MCF8252180.1 hypothetical protein [Saprospiraceae bacterium]MCF8281567.1 hypothetical protein [Bacteroidales bacterium]MCF8313849.1 hypothetical protein [Saprospiraceae bacterium]MCF8442559.1 hypothetical protein [Saprospiraceae bacterium]